MSEHFQTIYANRAREYHRFIAAEDVEGALLKGIKSVVPLAGQRVLDFGTGTGRIPLLVQGQAAEVVGLDLYRDMLTQQTVQRSKVNGHWPLVQADMRFTPIETGWANLVTAGWAIGHFCGWYADDWKPQIAHVLREMQRTCAAGGTLIIFETLTTGSLTPAPPSEGLAAYYHWLEQEWGFERTTLSTDYQFESVEQAVDYTEFFFGPELSAKIRANGWSRLPEWTGMWVKRV
jgi:ubiquinone/menaquinone biosynthesis C-methylase UbiE